MKFEVPQRRQLSSGKRRIFGGAPYQKRLSLTRTPLTLFAPAPYTISFVPLTRNLSLANPSPTRGWTGLSDATATRFSVLRTTKCDAFSEARRTKNRLLRYGIRIRCSKRLPVAMDYHVFFKITIYSFVIVLTLSPGLLVGEVFDGIRLFGMQRTIVVICSNPHFSNISAV